MATIKAYTDLKQSKKLAEILPLESADMCYPLPCEEGDKPLLEPCGFGSTPCWSLAALLNALNFPCLTQENENKWEVCVFDHDNDGYIEKTASNPVDACVAMIIHLHELKML